MTPVLFGVYGYQCWTQIAFPQCCWLKCLWFGCLHYTLNKFLGSFCIIWPQEEEKKHAIFCSLPVDIEANKYSFCKIGSTCLCNVPTVHFMFANMIIIITEKYSSCHRLLTLPWRQDNIELVICWELIFHFWAKKEHKAFWTQGWKTSWSVISWWLPWKFQLPKLYNYVQSHWQPAGHNFGLKYFRVWQHLSTE